MGGETREKRDGSGVKRTVTSTAGPAGRARAECPAARWAAAGLVQLVTPSTYTCSFHNGMRASRCVCVCVCMCVCVCARARVRVRVRVRACMRVCVFARA